MKYRRNAKEELISGFAEVVVDVPIEATVTVGEIEGNACYLRVNWGRHRLEALIRKTLVPGSSPPRAGHRKQHQSVWAVYDERKGTLLAYLPGSSGLEDAISNFFESESAMKTTVEGLIANFPY